ncbi:hypothetical protein E4U43_000710 [Claviceps pusilla]|uniref:Uncharacterized protein n=1 Tax=Claviceps pusilla TaxID=123648 RepID=A0A9P7SZY0_9HYPO|nr:hypothetical protein E4U43_000710 [Claviceps pusilla]
MDSQALQEQTNMVMHSVISSGSYSPMALGRLPQPVPSDLPPGMDAKVFTFQDAFEDLLVASKGQKLPDIRTRYQQRQLLRNMFPNGEPAWFWLRRLESQGLVRPLDPFTFIGIRQPHWPIFHEERHVKDAEARESAQGEDTIASSGLFEKMRRAITDLERGMFRDSPELDDARRVDERKQRDGPNNFAEFFSEISSGFNESQSSWDTFLKNVVQGGTGGGIHDKNQLSTLADRDKKDVVTTEEEHVDRFGYLHKTVTRKTLDAEGREVGLETYVTIRPADEHINNADNEGNNQQGPPETQNSAKASTWK